MATVNKVMLLGNLTRDPEVRYTPKGTAVCEIGMALNRVRTGDNGEKIESVTFVDVTLWARTAELAEQYLSKGRSVFIEGRLEMDEWEDKETDKKRQKLKVVAENMQFIGGKPDGEKREGKPLGKSGDPDPGEAYRKANDKHKAQSPDPQEMDEDGIPF